jgi:hypothetical protein
MCQSWECINSFSSWIAAVGTVATLAWAIWIATSDRRPRIKILTYQMMKGTPVVKSDSRATTVSSDSFHPFYVGEITNIGQCPVTLKSCGWLVPLRPGRKLLTKSDTSLVDFVKEQSTKLPCILKYGEQATFIFDPWTLPGSDHQPHGSRWKFIAWVRARYCRFQVTTSVGKRFTVRANSLIRSHVWNLYKQKINR